jgi:hypothetical protein
MSINVPNKGQLDGRIGNTSVALRNAMDDIANLYLHLTELGSDVLISMGYTSDDVNALLATYGALNQLTSAYEGGGYAGPALPFNFKEATAAWWNGV